MRIENRHTGAIPSVRTVRTIRGVGAIGGVSAVGGVGAVGRIGTIGRISAVGAVSSVDGGGVLFSRCSVTSWQDDGAHGWGRNNADNGEDHRDGCEEVELAEHLGYEGGGMGNLIARSSRNALSRGEGTTNGTDTNGTNTTNGTDTNGTDTNVTTNGTDTNVTRRGIDLSEYVMARSVPRECKCHECPYKLTLTSCARSFRKSFGGS